MTTRRAILRAISVIAVGAGSSSANSMGGESTEDEDVELCAQRMSEALSRKYGGVWSSAVTPSSKTCLFMRE